MTDPISSINPESEKIKTNSDESGNAKQDSERTVLEKLVFANLNEQRASRRWSLFFRFLWVTLAVVVILWFAKQNAQVADVLSPHTAVVEIKGVIASGSDASAELIVAALKSAFEDKAAKAVVLLINSPGGSPVQAGIINDEIWRLKTLHQKPVFSVVEESCASAAYYVAVATDQIFVNKASIVGSIGVLMDGFGFTGLMDKLGVERRLMTAGRNKGFLDPFSPQTPNQRTHAQMMLNDIHDQFIEAVKRGRGSKLKETPETFSGLFWSGQQAINLGLADQLGSVDYVARDVVHASEIIDYTRRENVAERLAKRFGASLGDAAIQGLQKTINLR